MRTTVLATDVIYLVTKMIWSYKSGQITLQRRDERKEKFLYNKFETLNDENAVTLKHDLSMLVH